MKKDIFCNIDDEIIFFTNERGNMVKGLDTIRVSHRTDVYTHKTTYWLNEDRKNTMSKAKCKKELLVLFEAIKEQNKDKYNFINVNM